VSVLEAARFQVALTRAKAKGRVGDVYVWLAARLPHELVSRVLAHVWAATLRPDENANEPRYEELVGRWGHRELQGRAAERHKLKERRR
jgi:hypothetical protein